MNASARLPFSEKRILITGGSGTLGQALLGRLLSGELGLPAEITLFSRDEAKQHELRLRLDRQPRASDDVIYKERRRVRFHIGDVADYSSIASALRGAEIVFHAAAMKQIPTCEYFPFEAVRTNVLGAANVVRAIREQNLPVTTAVAVSTDKACQPVNAYGMTKGLAERLFVQANLDQPKTRFVTARYGNIFASRGSVIPLFLEQIRQGGPVTLTTTEMTRFLMTMDEAVDTILAAATEARPGETYVPRVRAVRIADLAAAMIGDRAIEVRQIGIRPGEKLAEILVSEEEASRTVVRGQFLVILPMLPQLRRDHADPLLESGEYRSDRALLTRRELDAFLAGEGREAVDSRKRSVVAGDAVEHLPHSQEQT